jgi:hypothetical protein
MLFVVLNPPPCGVDGSLPAEPGPVKPSDRIEFAAQRERHIEAGIALTQVPTSGSPIGGADRSVGQIGENVQGGTILFGAIGLTKDVSEDCSGCRVA